MTSTRLFVSIFYIVACTVTAAPKQSVSECDNDKKVPYRAIVKEDGTVEISCRFVDCVNASKDGPTCETNWHGQSCNHLPQWIHGVRQPSGGKGSFQTKCCTYARMSYARYLGTTLLRRRQGFLGGFAYIKGQENTNKRDGFDVIANMTKEGEAYRIWVYRLRCIAPPRNQQQPQKSEDYFDTKSGRNPNIDYQQVHLPEQKPQPPVQQQQSQQSRQAPAVRRRGCFDSSTIVDSQIRGQITIDQIRVGEPVLTIDGKTVSYRPVSFWLHRDPKYTTRYLTLHTERPGVSVTMTPYHITFSDDCSKDPSLYSYPQKFAIEVRPGQCLVSIDRETSQIERVRVTNVTESYRRGIFSPVTPNGLIVTNDLISSCYSFIKHRDLQATIFHYMMQLEELLQYYLSLPGGWLLGGQRTKVDVPRALDAILSTLNHMLPVDKVL